MRIVDYEADFYAWANQQAELLRQQQGNHLDWMNLAEEIEAMGRSEKRQLASRLEVLIMHLLKWQYQPNFRSRSCQLTIQEQRLRLGKLLQENPSLKPMVAEIILSAYPLAVISAERETGLSNYPEDCPYSPEQLLSDLFLP
ncbi:DUF29 domain-containing protein [Cylindrospermopsis raciborskii Cr2010]|uniref:DUF29 domain-containing protein n=1 Tax=Cylindrospermopsis raciborskii TaxID=77022 RepID=UPI000E1E58EB|nr:DUF29 domain-containing protein [Cylindrospermopsis raciborskii]UJL33094.1 DUF29 domain-containing protein [Cylindrospermopsis raciborskii Cr2010]